MSKVGHPIHLRAGARRIDETGARPPWPGDASEAVWRGGQGAVRENSIAMAMNLPIASVRFGRLELFQSPIVDNPMDCVAVVGAGHRFPGDREPWQGHGQFSLASSSCRAPAREYRRVRLKTRLPH
jgi:hypothetical protein